MSFKLKKILVLIMFFVIVIGISFLLWVTFFRGGVVSNEVVSDVTPNVTVGNLPGAAGDAGDRIVETGVEGGELPEVEASPTAIGGKTETTSLTLRGVSDVQLAPDGSSMNYFSPNDGKFYNVDAEGNRIAIFNESFKDAETIRWAGDSSKAVVEFPDGANVMVDLTTGNVATLPSHWEDFQFSPNNEQIIAKSIGIDPSNRWLVISEPNGSGAQTIAALGDNFDKVTTSWSPNDQVVAFSDTGIPISGFGRKQMLAVGKNHENFPGLIVEGFSFEPIWNDTGSQILYSTAGPSSNYLPQLWLTDGNSDSLGGHRRSIALNTWADKCTYSSDTIAYCAVPQRMPEGSGLQRVLARGIPDTIYRVDTQSGFTSVVGEPDSPTSMTSLTVSDDGSTLFYQNEISGTLHKLMLK